MLLNFTPDVFMGEIIAHLPFPSLFLFFNLKRENKIYAFDSCEHKHNDAQFF